jgi:hypothetical protein
MSPDKKEFTFSYTRKNSDKVHYRILYDHEHQKILLMEKTINEVKIQIREEENRNSFNNNCNNKQDSKSEKEKPDTISLELSGMLDDITKNVEKKTN